MSEEVWNNYKFESIIESDCKEIVEIFNYYIVNSFAAFPAQIVTDSFFCNLLITIQDYPNIKVIDEERKLIGFGMVRPHHPFTTFSHTGVVTYFIHQDYTGRGIGSDLLKILEEKSRDAGIKILLAEISSMNHGSILFHQKKGFIRCGEFKDIGVKNGKIFSTIWMQKKLICNF